MFGSLRTDGQTRVSMMNFRKASLVVWPTHLPGGSKKEEVEKTLAEVSETDHYIAQLQ